MSSTRFLQGIFDFEGGGLHEPFLLDPRLTYTVPAGNEAQFVYFRGGNSSSEMVCAIVMRDGEPMRYFPIGARGACHVPLRVVEDLPPDTELAVHLAAPERATGTLVVDVGIIES